MHAAAEEDETMERKKGVSLVKAKKKKFVLRHDSSSLGRLTSPDEADRGKSKDFYF